MLRENKKIFLNNQIRKDQYRKRMLGIHKILYEYADFINGSGILDITIKDGNVYFNILNDGVQIKMVCVPRDITSVPFEFLNFGSYEIEENKFLLDIVKDNNVVLDVGANLGWYTLNWLKRLKNISVFSFEPIPNVYGQFIQNLTLNGQQIKNAFNFGLANVNADVDFFFDRESYGASSMVNLRETKNTIKVKCAVKRIDDVFPSFNVSRLDFIKCDVEGAEKLVFEGGIETIKKYKPIIFSEMLRKWSKKFNYHPNDTIKLFASIGYDCYVIHNNKLQKIKSVTDNTLETNFVFLNKNKHTNLISKLIKIN